MSRREDRHREVEVWCWGGKKHPLKLLFRDLAFLSVFLDGEASWNFVSMTSVRSIEDSRDWLQSGTIMFFSLHSHYHGYPVIQLGKESKVLSLFKQKDGKIVIMLSLQITT